VAEPGSIQAEGRPLTTFSIVACDLGAGEWGVAVASKFPAVGAVVPWAEPQAGAVATQAWANPRYGPQGLDLLRRGAAAPDAVDRLLAGDDGRDHRQLGMVDARGGAATHTGTACLEWAGGRTGPGYAAQGNLLVSAATVEALAGAFEASAGRPLAERLLACLEAAQRAGGDRRGQQSAALLVVRRDGGYGGLSDSLVDLRVDDHPQPLQELARLHGIHQEVFGQTPRSQWLPVGPALAAELRRRLVELGHGDDLEAGLRRWAGMENLEERLDGSERLDPVLIDKLLGRR